MLRVFYLRAPMHVASLKAFVDANWEAMAATGRPLQITCAPFYRTRSQEANALMWVRLTQIAEQAWINGQQFAPETWHEHFKRLLLPEMNARGQSKWRLLPNGDRVLAMSTTSLNTREMNDYMTALEAQAASIGVDLT